MAAPIKPAPIKPAPIKPAAPTAARSGILLLVLALSLAAFGGALMKTLTGELSPMLIGWVRFTGFFLIITPVALARVGRRALRPPRPGVQIVRGLLHAASNVCFVSGVFYLNFADAIAILYVYPFLMVMMAPAVLGERVSVTGWLGVAGGFGGVLLVMRPDFQSFDIGAILVLTAGFLIALQMLLNRKLGVLSDPTVISMWGALAAALVLSLTLPFVWQPITAPQLGILALTALTGAISHTLMILAFSRAPASDLAPFTYSEIVSAVLIGLVMFGTLPDMVSWSGIALITLSGVIVARAQAARIVLRRQPKI
jgi:drug/metabolite transporter (DMT)-like permease